MALLVMMGAIWQSAINNRFFAMAWIGVVIGGALLNLVAKESFDRPRPPEVMRHRAVLETNESYPSGHSMGSAIGYGMLGYALLMSQRHRPRRIAILLFVAGMFLMVGFSRIYLRAHWFSDVIAGWTIGLAWLFLAIGILEMRMRRGLAP
jgi:undecaprenyl-diphosphatase